MAHENALATMILGAAAQWNGLGASPNIGFSPRHVGREAEHAPICQAESVNGMPDITRVVLDELSP